MAMAQFAGSSSGSATGAAAAPAPAAASRSEIQLLLSKFDVMINQMQDYPAKDTINALTMLAERVQFAPDVVSFLETKIHRAPPNYKLPIFYLTDSILKNVGGPYPGLFARVIVPLYCNCVRQVSGKDLRRFVHVLNTWETSRLFPVEAIGQMRTAANRALAAADPSTATQPVSFSQQPPPNAQSQFRAGGAQPTGPNPAQQQDMELRSLLTKLQNDMGIHPTEHMSLEEVRTNNPEYYRQLLEFHAESKSPAAPPVAEASPGQGILPLETAKPIARPTARADPRRGPSRPAQSSGAQPPAVLGGPPPSARRVSPAAAAAKGPVGGNVGSASSTPSSSRGSGPSGEAAGKSANVAHLMQLLKRKQTVPPPANPQELNEITNDVPNKPDPAAVMSILQKLKGLSQPQQQPSAPAPAQVPQTTGLPAAMPQGMRGPPPQSAMPPPPGGAPPKNDNASRMWFSDKIIAHKDRVESNVQKLYAALPLVCRESGLRFREQAKLDAHLDFLFQYNRAQKERGKGGVSRSWYPDEEQWVTDFASERAPRESTSSSFFDRKESEDDIGNSWESACVPVDESITRCRICGENFARSWDEEEEDWMYTNAIKGTIQHENAPGEQTIFHKYCYDTVMANSSCITPAHLIPMPAENVQTATDGVRDMELDEASVPTSVGEKRAIEEEDSDSDEDDIKRVRTE